MKKKKGKLGKGKDKLELKMQKGKLENILYKKVKRRKIAGKI